MPKADEEAVEEAPAETPEEHEQKKLEKLTIGELATIDKELALASELIRVRRVALNMELDRRNVFIVGEKQAEWSNARYGELEA